MNAVYQLHDRPRVWAGVGTKRWGELRAPGGQRAYLLTHPMWNFGVRSVLPFRRAARQLRSQGISLVLLTNTVSERRLARVAGLRSEWANRNIHVCERAYVPLAGTPTTYDAVYTAAAKPYKRIHLAQGIERLYIVTYFWPDVRDAHGHWDLHAFEPRVAHARFNRHRLEPRAINRILNQSICGLALSRREGAMVAVMEYLLAGLPVVSTPSRGGRNLWFDPEFVAIVRPTVEAVRQGVRRFKDNPVPAHEIRQATLARLDAQRRRYYGAFRRVLLEAGVRPGPSYEEFHEATWGQEGISKLRIL